jgi:ubiquinone biosynthesis monooxygenase Coq7
VLEINEPHNSFQFQIIKKFRDEELEHHDTGIEHGAELAPQYKLLSKIIKVGCQTAIKIAERV